MDTSLQRIIRNRRMTYERTPSKTLHLRWCSFYMVLQILFDRWFWVKDRVKLSISYIIIPNIGKAFLYFNKRTIIQDYSQFSSPTP